MYAKSAHVEASKRSIAVTNLHTSLPRTARWALALAAGVAMRFGYGLEPIAWLALLAPVPLLVAAQHASAREAALLALVAALIGPVLPWSYLAGLMPLPVVVGIAAAMALQWAAVIVIARLAQRRAPAWSAPFAFGLALAAFDVLLVATSPDGTASSLAYTQAGMLPLLQLASLGSTPAIVFAMGLVAATLAITLDRAARERLGARALVLPVALIAAAFGFGAWRLQAATEAAALPVAAVAIDARVADRRRDAAAFEELLARYEVAIVQAAASKPRLVLLPERIGDIAADDIDTIVQRLAAAARGARADIVVGFGVFGPEGNHNEAWWIDSGAGTLTRYRKQHLIQGLEARFAAGPVATVTRTVDARAMALAICKDMDFPSTILRSAAGEVSALVVPAWDFGADGWLHSRMALLRGVENGMPVLRSAREGRLTISDGLGRVRHEATSNATAVVLAGGLPARGDATLYARNAAVISWAWPVALLWLLALALRRAPPGR